MTTAPAQRIRGAFAALALLAFIVGIPCGLLALGADPARLLPDHWPDPVPIGQWPERIWNALRWAWLTGDLVLWLVVAVAWAGWFLLTLSVVVELIRQTGHGVRTARRLLRRVPRGRWIAGLVAAVLVATSAGTAAASTAPATPVAATAPPWPHQHPVTAAQVSATDQAAEIVESATTPVPAAARTDGAVPYTVVHGDTLWDLAERHLGRGTRYHEIMRLNPVLLADRPGDLEPGWTLLFPPDAVALPRPAEITTASGRTVTVEPTDTLSAIAERELGDPDAWHPIFDLNAGRTQPDGRALRHPDQILPGWHLVLPAQAAPPPAQPPEQPATPPNSPTPAPAPEGPATSAEQPAPPHAPRGEQPDMPKAQPGTGIALPTGAFVGLGLAALITLAMITVRLRRRRWYHPGARDDADPAGLPVVRALRIAHDTTAPQPADDNPAAAPAPPRHARSADIQTRDRAQATVRAVLPAPQDTSLGVRDGHAIALDLASTRGLGLTGPGAHAAARALIMTLLAQATSDDLDAMIVMPADDARALFGHDLADPVPDRLLVVDDLPAALATLEAELIARTDTGDLARDDPPANTAFSSGDTGPAVVVATPTVETNRRAHAVLDNGAHLGLAGVFLGPWHPGGTVRVRDDGTVEATSPTLSDDLAGTRLFTLPDTDARDLLALLHAAEPGSDDPIRDRTGASSAVETGTQRQSRAENTTASAEPPVFEYEFATEPDAAAVTPPTETASDNRGEHPTTGPSGPAESETTEPSPTEVSNHPRPSAARRDDNPTTEPRPATEPAPAPPLHLQVLGRLHLTRANPEPRDLIDVLAPRQREILVYLALHRDGCRREALSAALWPHAPGERPYNSFHATLSQLRRGLRRASNDDTLDLIVNQDSRYRLDQTILTADLWRLQDAITASRQASAMDAVAAANRVTELYRGDLAEGITADWIDGPREALRRYVLDALSTLIRKTRTDSPEQALALLEQARQLDPYNEAIYRDLMRLQARLNQHDSIPRTLDLLTTSLAELDQRPARSTLSLADALQQPRNHISNRQAS
ncbi:transcriptional regulator [Prauserella sp. PE36]|uniref:LysM peptidoglycan-binding domain-containing protein n=1 Tax=Prauserella sp. PE36 TaxID=1504709 RepID=UPI000DE298EB|nr:LysM peptidoglycan-binding domain-containing protein [Prauserella sp. PE36]RBM17401.1 transcriptional regulator [Prauserella sp. PE36]